MFRIFRFVGSSFTGLFNSTFGKIFRVKVMQGETTERYTGQTKKSDNFFNKLVKDDNHYNVSNFFLVVLTLISILLLLVPLSLTLEMWFNHTIATDLSGMAAYIVAVCGLLGIGGGTFGWTEWSKQKYNQVKNNIDELKNMTNGGGGFTSTDFDVPFEDPHDIDNDNEHKS